MKDTLIIRTGWESALHESTEVRLTSAMLKIEAGGQVVTRNEDVWAKTIRDDVRLSAYPLALWFAASWWRLRWESLPIRIPCVSWRMAHEMCAAGYGYLWPRMLFAFDGEDTHVWASQSASESTSPVRYLQSGHYTLDGTHFERTIDEFIAVVIARLDAVQAGRTHLHELWGEVIEERANPRLSHYRKLEAMLGFDPDECPEMMLRRFMEIGKESGEAALTEIAPVTASADPGAVLENILSFVSSEGLNGRIELQLPVVNDNGDHSIPSWQRGRDIARQARTMLGLNGQPLDDAMLCEIVNLHPDKVFGSHPVSRALLGVAVRRDRAGEFKFLFRKSYKPGRRFELARLIGDHLVADQNDIWLPETDAKTARQRIQRAFAAEFLCPIESLMSYLDNDFSTDVVDNAAEHFGVASRAIETQLVNNHVLRPEVLDDNGSGIDFPYISGTGWQGR